jgi:hypothetical protein
MGQITDFITLSQHSPLCTVGTKGEKKISLIFRGPLNLTKTASTAPGRFKTL